MHRFRLRSLLLACAAITAACTGTTSDEQAAPARNVSGDLSFLVFGEPEELKAYRNVIRSFKSVEPDVNIKLTVASDRDDLLARLATSFAGGAPPDLFLLNYRFYGQFAVRGVLDPVAPRLEASTAFEPEDFYPEAVEAFQLNGEQICLPQNISSLVVYYNKDLFADAGLEEPAEGWTWDEMVALAKILTRDEDGDGLAEQYGLGVEASIIRLAPFVWSNGGELVDSDENPTRFALDSPEAIEAMQKFFELHLVHGVIPGDEEIEAEDDTTRFLNGRTAMVLSSRRDTPTFRTITDFDWDIAPLPIHEQPAGILHSDAYCMTKASGNKDAAWRFMEYALGSEGQRITAESGRTVPSLIEVSTSDAFLDPNAKPANSQVFLDTIPIIRRVPNISTWPEIEDLAAGLMEAGLYGGVPADVIARRLIEQTQEIFARAE